MSHIVWSRCASVWEYLFFCVEDGWTPLHDPSLFFIFHGCGLPFSLFFFKTCFVGMWHTFFGYASFISFCIVHILDGHFREEESWYVMEFYFVGGWQYFAIFQFRRIAYEWMYMWSWSWEYDKSLKRVKKFDKTQSKVKLHMRVWSWKSNFGLGRNL